MSECPKNDAGHEPLHRLVNKTAKVDVVYDDGSIVQGAETMMVDAILRFDPGTTFEGPAGHIHACKHCKLLYFVEEKS